MSDMLRGCPAWAMMKASAEFGYRKLLPLAVAHCKREAVRSLNLEVDDGYAQMITGDQADNHRRARQLQLPPIARPSR